MADCPQPEIPAEEASKRGNVLCACSLRVAGMLWRNTVVSCGVFGLGLRVLYALVDGLDFPEVPAAGIGFLVANSLHYVLGRTWIFAGSERGPASGYALFLVNAGIGLAVTMALYAALLALHCEWTTSSRGSSYRCSPGWWSSCSTRCSTSAAS